MKLEIFLKLSSLCSLSRDDDFWGVQWEREELSEREGGKMLNEINDEKCQIDCKEDEESRRRSLKNVRRCQRFDWYFILLALT